MKHRASTLTALLFASIVLAWHVMPIWADPVKFTPEQQAAIDKVKSKGASVMPVAADSDQIAVNLGIAGKAVGDEELALIKALPNIVELDLHGTNVTDAGLASVEGLAALTRLHLEKTQVTDAGLAHLKGLTKLEYLNLYDDAGITDAGLSQLDGLKALKKLYLWQTKVTQTGADALKQAVPGIDINRGEEMTAAIPPPPPMPAPEAPKPAVKPAVADHRPDEDGFIRTWLVLAPIPLAPGVNGVEAIDKEQIPDEKDLKPKAGDTIKAGDKELTWKDVESPDFYVDFNAVLGAQTDNSVAYVVCYVSTEHELTDLQLLMGSDDQGKVYLNGKELVKNTAARGLIKDQDKAENVTLRSGLNTLVFKVINEDQGWQGCVRFQDKSGQPVKDLKLRVEPSPH